MRLTQCFLAVTVLCINFALCGCATTKRDWETARYQGTITAYEQFLQNHPSAEQASEAKRRIAQIIEDNEWKQADSSNSKQATIKFLEKYPNSYKANEKIKQFEFDEAWSYAESVNSSAGYREFLSKYPNTKKAQVKLYQLEENEAWLQAKRTNTIPAYESFVLKYRSSQNTNEASTILEKLRMEQALADGSTEALIVFVNTYPLSKYADQIRAKLDESSLKKALSEGTDDALITFIKKYQSNNKFVASAIKKLKRYELVKNGQVLRWSSLPTVYAGTTEEYPCGVELRAFSPLIAKETYKGKSFIAGSKRFYEDGSGFLELTKWTSFDNYIAKGRATVGKEGLVFDTDSIVLIKK